MHHKTKYLFTILITAACLFNGCSNGQVQKTDGNSEPIKTNLSASEFSDKIKVTPGATIVDVRTAREFSGGYIPEALNIDWNSSDFDRHLATLDKSKPVFVYCLSGGRSSAAAVKMRSEGFSEVYELNGGILKWRSAGLPEVTPKGSTSSGMTKKQFDSLIISDKLVLVDFYADWCAPCRRMKPFLEEIAKEYPDKVIVIRIDADENKNLCKELGVDALPIVQLYKNGKLTWNHAGFISKEDLLKQIQ